MRIPPIGFKPIYRWKVYDKRKPWPWLSFRRKSEPIGEKNLGFSLRVFNAKIELRRADSVLTC